MSLGLFVDNHPGSFILIMTVAGMVCAILVTILILEPEKKNELNQLKNMDCKTIKDHILSHDFGFMLDNTDYLTAYTLDRCDK